MHTQTGMVLSYLRQQVGNQICQPVFYKQISTVLPPKRAADTRWNKALRVVSIAQVAWLLGGRFPAPGS